MSSKIPIRTLSVAAMGAALALGAPSLARAGATIVTAHSLSISFHSATEFTNSGGDDKTDKTDVNQKELYNKCVGTAPTKTQGVYLFLSNGTGLSGDCTTPPLTATILAIDTQPLTRKAAVGTVTFGDPLIQNTTSHGAILKTIKVPATIHIDCDGAPTAELNGILNLSYSQFTKGAPVCPISGSIKITGTATDPSAPNDVIVDDGSNVKINKRAGGITVVPP
jgi:hypothetical protein